MECYLCKVEDGMMRADKLLALIETLTTPPSPQLAREAREALHGAMEAIEEGDEETHRRMA